MALGGVLSSTPLPSAQSVCAQPGAEARRTTQRAKNKIRVKPLVRNFKLAYSPPPVPGKHTPTPMRLQPRYCGLAAKTEMGNSGEREMCKSLRIPPINLCNLLQIHNFNLESLLHSIKWTGGANYENDSHHSPGTLCISSVRAVSATSYQPASADGYGGSSSACATAFDGPGTANCGPHRRYLYFRPRRASVVGVWPGVCGAISWRHRPRFSQREADHEEG